MNIRLTRFYRYASAHTVIFGIISTYNNIGKYYYCIGTMCENCVNYSHNCSETTNLNDEDFKYIKENNQNILYE